MKFPPDDNDFQEHKIERVTGSVEKGFELGFDGATGIWTGTDNPMKPVPGMTLRLYGKGFGYPVRGLFVDGVKFYYRTEGEDAEYRDIQLYGKDAQDWLDRWDAGRGVWSIEMGGLGPGYEQAIQITVAEVLRHLLEAKYDHAAWTDTDNWKRDRDLIEKAGFANPRIEKLGLSGAQWGAAVSLATKLYMDGPRKVMAVPEIKDRHIQVSRSFPEAA